MRKQNHRLQHAIMFGAALAVLKSIINAVKERKNKRHNSIEGEVSIQNITVYELIIKPVFDKVLSFIGLFMLAPLYGFIALAVYLDDPGPIFFTQTRVGRDKGYFVLHKFRTMKICTPHDVPTHQLADPEKYITRVGRILRKTSLDELPQIWDIFRGDMSIIGPRPALWNQEDLISERDKYNANSVLPGLTGLAQIRGRDELEIPVKARIDGEYVKLLRKSSRAGLIQDIKCLIGTTKSVLTHDGVVEGGTGAKKDSRNYEDIDPSELGCKKSFCIDKTKNKRILITGANSYIGESFVSYTRSHYPNLVVETIDMTDSLWREYDFSAYDTVFHVAGIAHSEIGTSSKEEQAKYYAVNRDLAVETAKKAKDNKVSQFIFMSSMIIYGNSGSYGKEKIIDEYTVPCPSNFYGDSKWQADKAVRKLGNSHFHVAVLRPPMIYGRGSKGNYQILAKLARKTPIFPKIKNNRSMLYIDNLCEFVSLLVLSGESGIYFPQNEKYSNTSDIVKTISQITGKKCYITKIFNPALSLASHVPGKLSKLVNKAFGNFVYRPELSIYKGLDYQLIDWKTSVILAEGSGAWGDAADGIIKTEKPAVLILVNHDVVVYNFRLELVEKLLEEGYDVHISSPYGERIDDLTHMGAKYHEIRMDRHGMNPVKEIKVLNEYRKLINIIRPLVVFTYTIKPNIYGGIAARMAKVPFISNITGLGIALENKGIKRQFILGMYRIGLYRSYKVFFQNAENMQFMIKNKIISGSYELLPGSGVNLSRYYFEPYPEDTEELVFTTIGRIMKDKGIDELIEAAGTIKHHYPKVKFRLIGFFDDDYENIVKEAAEAGTIEYIGQQKDIRPFITASHAIIQPSYHEGMSNVLLEAAATGRPVLASDIHGCKETFDEGITGLGFKVQSSIELAHTIEAFIHLPYEKKEEMGRAGRNKMEKEFDRKIVVEKYMREIGKINKERNNGSV